MSERSVVPYRRDAITSVQEWALAQRRSGGASILEVLATALSGYIVNRPAALRAAGEPSEAYPAADACVDELVNQASRVVRAAQTIIEQGNSARLIATAGNETAAARLWLAQGLEQTPQGMTVVHSALFASHKSRGILYIACGDRESDSSQLVIRRNPYSNSIRAKWWEVSIVQVGPSHGPNGAASVTARSGMLSSATRGGLVRPLSSWQGMQEAASLCTLCREAVTALGGGPSQEAPVRP